MRYIITTAAVVALIAGIALGFVASRGLDGSASAAPPPPADTKVREQNLDGSGLIRVHEQGTANVSGTVDVGNLPAVQDVKVVAMPAQESGPFEFMTIHARHCLSETALCLQGVGEPPTFNTEMTTLSAQGWSLVEMAPLFPNTNVLVLILRRPVP